MTEKVAIITDTTSTIKPGEIPDVYVVSLLVTVDNKTYRDGRELTPAEFNQALARKDTQIQTSLPKTEDFIAQVKAIVNQYDRIVLLPIASGLSGTYNQWRMLLDEEFKEYHHLHLFDTHDTAISLRWLVEDVLAMLRRGAAIADIEAYVAQWHTRIACTIVLNDLDRPIRGGRVGKVAGFVAKLIKIKPILLFHKNVLKIIDKSTFNNETAVKKSFDLFDKLFGFKQRQILRIGVCDTFSVREYFQKALTEIQNYVKKFKIKKVQDAPATAVIGAHTGAEAFSINILMNEPETK